ncbi:hypothetical protein PVAND_014620 [Polypedilum vanderplanki]|nr:hypothetical protein PVAND_014620 [Polypedilum vanderplanki]
MCFSDKKVLQDMVLDKIIQMQESKYQGNLDCFKTALKTIDPDTKILNSFDSKNIKTDCAKVIDDYGLKKALQAFESRTEPIHKLTCGAINENLIEKVAYSTLIYKLGSVNPDVLKDDKEKLKDFTAKKVNDACTCLMGKI